MNGMSSQELNAQRQRLIEKLLERFGPLPEALRGGIQTVTLDPEKPLRFKELLVIAERPNITNMAEFLREAMFESRTHGNSSQLLQKLEQRFGPLPHDSLRQALQFDPDNPNRLQELLGLAVQTDVTDITMFSYKAMFGRGSNRGSPQ